jgi:hypothetical protein
MPASGSAEVTPLLPHNGADARHGPEAPPSTPLLRVGPVRVRLARQHLRRTLDEPALGFNSATGARPRIGLDLGCWQRVCVGPHTARQPTRCTAVRYPNAHITPSHGCTFARRTAAVGCTVAGVEPGRRGRTGSIPSRVTVHRVLICHGLVVLTTGSRSREDHQRWGAREAGGAVADGHHRRYPARQVAVRRRWSPAWTTIRGYASSRPWSAPADARPGEANRYEARPDTDCICQKPRGEARAS